MKNIITALLALIIITNTYAQFGGFGLSNLTDKVPGMAPVTADSLLNDVLGGNDYFLKAQVKFAQAILPTEEVLKINAEIEANKAKKDGPGAVAMTKKFADANKAAAEKLIQEGKPLSEEAKKLISEGRVEALKGVGKWALLAVAIIKAAQSGNTDAKFATAIVAAKQAAQDLPELKKMLDTMQQLNDITDKSK